MPAFQLCADDVARHAAAQAGPDGGTDVVVISFLDRRQPVTPPWTFCG